MMKKKKKIIPVQAIGKKKGKKKGKKGRKK